MGWKLNSERQIWLQLADVLKFRIVSGQYPAGIRMPSERDLASEAGVNPNTMQRALVSLEESGLVSALRNTGRYVTQDTNLIAATRSALAEAELKLFRERMRQLGYSIQETEQFLERWKINE